MNKKASKETAVTVNPNSFEYFQEQYSKLDSHFSALSEHYVKEMRKMATTHEHWLCLCRIEHSDDTLSMAIETSGGFEDLKAMYLMFSNYSNTKDTVLNIMSRTEMTPAQEKTYQKFVKQRVAYKKSCLEKEAAREARKDREDKPLSCFSPESIKATYGIGRKNTAVAE